MDPELLQSIADEQGLPVQHFDGYSVVGHPTEGPITVAHPPGARVPAREGVPPLLARPPEPPPSIATTPPQQRADRLRREAASQRQAYDTDRQTASLAAEEQAQLDAIEARRGIASEPDEFGIVTRHYPGGRTERTGPPGAFELERRRAAEVAEAGRVEALRHTPTSAGTRVFPDGARVTTDAQGRSVMPPVDMERLRAEMGDTEYDHGALTPYVSDRTAAAESAVGDFVGGLPLVQALSPAVSASTAEAQTQASPTDSTIGPDGVPSMLARPTGPAPVPPGAAPVRPSRVAGGPARRPAVPPMTLPGALDALAGTPQARQAFDGTISSLAGDYAGPRRDPDLIDRQMLLEQQRAGLAQRAAHTQAQIEAQVEAERQQLEQDRQRAMQGARQRYQNAIDRVSSMHLDPNHFFRDQGAFGTVSSVVAVALGALGQALTGSSTNGALDQINAAIDRDMQAQQSDIESARVGADMQGNMIDIMRTEFSDAQAAHDAARAAMLQQAALHVQEMEGSLAGQEAQNNADALRSQLEGQAEEARQAAEARQAEIDLHHAQTLRELARAQQESIRANRMGMGGTARPPHVTSAMLANFDAIRRANPDVSPEDAAMLADLPPGFVPTQSSAADPSRARAAASTALSELEAAVPAEGDIPSVGVADSRAPDWLLSDEGRRVRALAQRTLVRLLRVDSGGVIGPDEIAQYAQMYGLAPGSTETQFREGVRAMRADLDAGVFDHLHTGSAPDREHAAVGFTPD